MSLYTVRYTTRRIISTYAGAAGGVGQVTEVVDIDQIITGLPLITAQSYAGCDNYRLEVEMPEPAGRKSRRPSNQASERQVAAPRVPPSRTPRKSALATAAETGDLSAAISEVV